MIGPVRAALALTLALASGAAPARPLHIVLARPTRGPALHLIADGHAAPVITASGDDDAVQLAAADLRDDLARVSGSPRPGTHGIAVLVGTIGHCPPIDRLIAAGRLDPRGVRGRWEGFVQQVVRHPAPGLDAALVIAGADRRGTVYGIYDLSARIGVSPWAWWADVPVARRRELWLAGTRHAGHPAVRYRGLFINDEEPALGGWARARFGGMNARFYGHVYALLLRLKGNLLWPAMWGKSLWQDDPASAVLAQRRGVVLGTSHHEPMQRAQVEWARGAGAAWDYARNAPALEAFWRAGLARSAGADRIITVGMRGDGDLPMAPQTSIPLLESIVAAQRRIIAGQTGAPAAQTPQVWALYKEVQDYYDAGMRVPDDVTLLFSDDNWGNLRRLPDPAEHRAGGAGIYYHFDYVGGPRNYKWLNTTQIERVWDQLDLARTYHADRLWIANVGDIKPMELPLSFFMDLAWAPRRWPAGRLASYYRGWAAQQFGVAQADAIGALLADLSRLNAQMKPELLDARYYLPGGGAETRPNIGDYDALAPRIAATRRRLAPGQRAAFFELVEHPFAAMANLHRLYATQAAAARARACHAPDAAALDAALPGLLARDAALAARYEALEHGKWPHMMAQTHIGYSGWQEPPANVLPALTLTPVQAQCGAAPAAAPAQAIAAGAFTASRPAAGARWRLVPNLGIWGGSLTVMPRRTIAFAPGAGPRLDYRLTTTGPLDITLLAAPTLDVSARRGLRLAVALDAAPPVVVDLARDDALPGAWDHMVAGNLRRAAVWNGPVAPGVHTLHIWAIDPEVVIERLELRARPGRKRDRMSESDP